MYGWAILTAGAVGLFFDLFWNWTARAAWADAHPGIAGWAQAIGTVAAIIATAWIANRQQRLSMADQRERRDSLAGVVAARLGPLVNSIEVEARRVRQATKLFDYGRALIGISHSGPADREAKKQMLFNLAWRDNIYDNFDALPPRLAFKACQLLYAVADYDRIVGGLLAHGAEHGVDKIFDMHEKQVEPMLLDVETLLADVKPGLKAIFKARA